MRDVRRILMTADPIGGVWTYAVELCRGLEQAGIEVILATMGAALSDDQRAEIDALANVEVEESRYRLEWMDDPWDDVDRAGDWLLALENQIRPDVIHLNGYAHGALPWRTPVLVVGHSCVLSWWRATKRSEAPPRWAEYAWRVQEGLRHARLVIAPSWAMLNALQRHYGPLPNGVVIHNGRTPQLFAPCRKEPCILSVGRFWDAAKNVSVLAEAAADLSWQVQLVGEPPDPSGRVGRCRNVAWLGRRSGRQLAELYGRASVYALPARYEPFGLSILEAAFSGCALVLGDIPSLRELWSGVAEFVDGSSSAEVAAVLNRLTRDPVRTRMLGEQARRRARQFNAEHMVESYLNAYHGLRTVSTLTEANADLVAPA